MQFRAIETTQFDQCLNYLYCKMQINNEIKCTSKLFKIKWSTPTHGLVWVAETSFPVEHKVHNVVIIVQLLMEING